MPLLRTLTEQLSIADIWRQYRAQTMIGLFLFQLLAVYAFIQLWTSSGIEPKLPLDAKIPVVPLFIVPYFLYFLILPLPFVAAYRHENGQRSLFATAMAFFVAATICNFIFIVFPTSIQRPAFTGSGFYAEALRFLHSVDGSVGLFPSGHVTYSLLGALTTMHTDKKLSVGLWLSALAIMPATVFTKQHFVVDIIGGVLVAVFVYFAVYQILLSYLSKQELVEGDEKLVSG